MIKVFRKIQVHPKYTIWSDLIHHFPEHFQKDDGVVLYKGRNEIRVFKLNQECVAVKSFRVPHLINRIVYGFLRASKAERSYRYAEMFQKVGIGTPQPVGYYTQRKGLLFDKSYYASLLSACPYTYADLLRQHFPEQEKILKAIAQTTARMHEQGFLHKDYGRGNILFGITEQGINVEIIDLNRIRFCKINLSTGCKNFERLPMTSDMLTTLAIAYAEARGYDPQLCIAEMQRYVTLITDCSK